MAWPGWYPYPGIWYGGPYLSFGVGFGIGLFGGFGWGWGHWGFDWHDRYAIFDHGRYYSRSNTFYNRNDFYRGGGGRGGFNGAAAEPRRGSAGDQPAAGARGGVYNRPGATARPFNGNTRRLEDTLHPAVRAASARAPSAATSMADRQKAIRHAEAPASVAESGFGGGGGSAAEGRWRRWRRWRASVIEVS